MSKITRARNQKRPGTSGGGRNQEGEALNRTPSVGIRLWAVFKRGSAHEPPPENVASASDVVGSGTGGGYVRSVYAPEPLDLRFMKQRMARITRMKKRKAERVEFVAFV